MAVITSGEETIVRYSRGLVGVYYVLVVASGIIAGLSLMVAFGSAVEHGSWTHKLVPVFSWIAGAVSFALVAIQMYTMARAYSRTYVAIGPEGVRLHLPNSDGTLLSIGQERRFPWNQIDAITCEHDRRKRICRFNAGEFAYTLTQNNCPSPGRVAQFMADGKGVPLTAPKVSA